MKRFLLFSFLIGTFFTSAQAGCGDRNIEWYLNFLPHSAPELSRDHAAYPYRQSLRIFYRDDTLPNYVGRPSFDAVAGYARIVLKLVSGRPAFAELDLTRIVWKGPQGNEWRTKVGTQLFTVRNDDGEKSLWGRADVRRTASVYGRSPEFELILEQTDHASNAAPGEQVWIRLVIDADAPVNHYDTSYGAPRFRIQTMKGDIDGEPAAAALWFEESPGSCTGC